MGRLVVIAHTAHDGRDAPHFSTQDPQVTIEFVAALLAAHLLLNEGQIVLDGLEGVVDLVRNRGRQPAQSAHLLDLDQLRARLLLFMEQPPDLGEKLRVLHGLTGVVGRHLSQRPIFIGKGLGGWPAGQHQQRQQVIFPHDGNQQAIGAPPLGRRKARANPFQLRRSQGDRLSPVLHSVQENLPVNRGLARDGNIHPSLCRAKSPHCGRALW